MRAGLQRSRRMVLAALCGVVLCGWGQAWAQSPTYADQLYGKAGGANLLVDIYIPTVGKKPFPLLIYIHGGGWFTGKKSEVTNYLLTREALGHGIAVASISYRLTSPPDRAVFPAQIHDVKSAVRFLRDHTGVYGLDGTRFAAFGTSAGGHLAALLGTSCGVKAAEGNVGTSTRVSSCVQAVIDFFGPTDILNMNLHITTPPGSDINHDAPGSPESALIGWSKGIGDLRKNQNSTRAPYPTYLARVKLANPITHVDAKDPPFFIAHGKNDRLVPLKQSTLLANALKRVGVKVEYHEVAGKGHGDVGNAIEKKAFAFLQQVFYPPKPRPEPPPRREPSPRPEPSPGPEPSPRPEPPPVGREPTPGPEPTPRFEPPPSQRDAGPSSRPDVPGSEPPMGREPLRTPDVPGVSPPPLPDRRNPDPGCLCASSAQSSAPLSLLLLCIFWLASLRRRPS